MGIPKSISALSKEKNNNLKEREEIQNKIKKLAIVGGSGLI
jgi:hypothetical protein